MTPNFCIQRRDSRHYLTKSSNRSQDNSYWRKQSTMGSVAQLQSCVLNLGAFRACTEYKICTPDSQGDEELDNWATTRSLFFHTFLATGPILMIFGGEGGIEPETGLLYPFVTHHLAVTLGAYVLQPEHRFYGDSQPITTQEIEQARAAGQPDPRVKLLTSEQALLDAIQLLQSIKAEVGCDDPQNYSATYCPVITVGGSYPGFLGAMARLVFPNHIDMAYAASAPMKFYAQTVPPSAYYEHITTVAEQAVPGCSTAVKQTLMIVQAIFRNCTSSFHENARQVGVCPNTIRSYIQDTNSFLEELFMMVGYTFAKDNMAYYPPSNQTRLAKACHTLLLQPNSSDTAMTKLKHFLVDSLPTTKDHHCCHRCVDMQSQLPTGPYATISSGDWSGVGTGRSGESWDFQTCSLLIEAIGFDAEHSMFPERAWTLNWLQLHCQSRFGVTPQPYALVQQWKWDQLVQSGASRILFTNGLNDGWSVSGIQQNLSQDLLALNFPNGAHHSDLTGRGPPDDDTDDLREGFQIIQTILTTWLQQVKQHSRIRRRDFRPAEALEIS